VVHSAWCLHICLSGGYHHVGSQLTRLLLQWVFTCTLPFLLLMKSRMLLESTASGLETSLFSLISDMDDILNHS
jgi:hypothetical protein